eukprot:NODE_1558_length_1112_cov_334.112583.p1 GENE.NODE_1558_length_1112_cov_334.112583~~NODE_1558_length_1112_cov_334.112583.p1  ORF type:complete len:316 (+),score=73.80 NODE_1558_length_1112_cov_334.112583:83-1030(+)
MSILEAARVLQETVDAEVWRIEEARRAAEAQRVEATLEVDALRAAVEQERAELEAERCAMQALNRAPGGIVAISAGGTTFKTRRATLCQVEGSMLAAMFSGRWDGSLTYDEQGAVFLDTSPPVFEAVLSHLRTLSLDPCAEPPEVALSLRPEVVAFREFMMLRDASDIAGTEPEDYVVVEVSNAKVRNDGSLWMVNATVEHAQRILRPHMGASAGAAIAFDDGGRLVLRFTDPCMVSGVRLKLHANWKFGTFTVRCDVSCRTAVLGRGDFEFDASPETHTLTFDGQYRVEGGDMLTITLSCVAGWRLSLRELSFF